MFSYAVLVERNGNPLMRSLASPTPSSVAPSPAGGVVAAMVVLFEGSLSLIFAGLSLALFGHDGFGAGGVGVEGALIDTIRTAFSAPTGALLLIGLTVTYADLRTADRP